MICSLMLYVFGSPSEPSELLVYESASQSLRAAAAISEFVITRNYQSTVKSLKDPNIPQQDNILRGTKMRIQYVFFSYS